MENKSGTWVEFYQEFATAVKPYKSNRKKLIEKLQAVYEDNDMKFPKMERDGTVADIDPFTIFAMFNKGITENNRMKIISGLAKEFSVSVNLPEDFDGIPVMNNMAANFFAYEDQRGLEDIENLWKVFENALNYADDKKCREELIKYYDIAIQQKGVRWTLTMGLFWIRPYIFVNLDSNNRNYILSEGVLPEKMVDEFQRFKNIPEGTKYLELCEFLTKRLNENESKYKNLIEFSASAWTTSKTEKEVFFNGNTEYWPTLEEYNPGLSSDMWFDFLKEDKKSYPSTLKMLKAMIELGGEATCKSISELLGEHASAWVSRGNNLGKRVKNRYSLPACMDGDKERFFPIPFFGREIMEKGKKHYAWKIRPELKEAVERMTDVNEGFEEQMKTDVSKNTILYGPPGTGKTYNTVIFAVAIIENKKYQTVKDEDYSDVLARYNNYKDEGLIEFTTFHQSYGYEEFIEGIKPELSADTGDIIYRIQSGVFKKFCEKAESFKNLPEEIDVIDKKVWVVSVNDEDEIEECFENGAIGIPMLGAPKNFVDDTVINNPEVVDENSLIDFQYEIKVNDIVVMKKGVSTITGIGIIKSDAEYNDIDSEKYPRRRKVKWLFNNLSLNWGIGTTESFDGCCRSASVDSKAFVEKVFRTFNPLKNYVFIIDEINRGNISKIFGELITLIESTKRIGKEEEVKVRLPYSQHLFGVPDNVYLIGTMNTADRSIATIDTALRRRFKFKEMLPDAEVLEGIVVDDVDIKEMFIKLNKRIAVLFDREHTLGHAYFLPLKTEPTFEKLSEIFKDNIMPLLQEYFFEDYGKIRLVLGDNSKENREYQFIVEEENEYNDLFGETDYGFDDEKHYKINEEAFGNIEAYRLI